MNGKNETWELVEKPPDNKAIRVKCLYKIKFNPYGTILNYKARHVVNGYSQQFDINSNETFAHVSRHDTIRAVLALAASKRWKIH